MLWMFGLGEAGRGRFLIFDYCAELRAWMEGKKARI